MAAPAYSFRIEASGLDAFVSDMNRAAAGNDALTAAWQRFITASPQLSSAMDRAQAATVAAADKVRALTAAKDVATKSTGDFGRVIGQAGFQIQDFTVQVAGGQNAMLAFAQQGSQLAGIFGPAGAMAGAGLAIAAVVASLLGAKSAAEQFKETMKDQAAAFKVAGEEAERWRDGLSKEANQVIELRGYYQQLSGERRAYETRQLERQREALGEQTDNLRRTVERPLGGLVNTAQLEQANAAAANLPADQRELFLSNPDLQRLRDANDALQSFRAAGTITEDTLSNLSARFREIAGDSGDAFSRRLRSSAEELEKNGPQARELAGNVRQLEDRFRALTGELSDSERALLRLRQAGGANPLQALTDGADNLEAQLKALREGGLAGLERLKNAQDVATESTRLAERAQADYAKALKASGELSQEEAERAALTLGPAFEDAAARATRAKQTLDAAKKAAEEAQRAAERAGRQAETDAARQRAEADRLEARNTLHTNPSTGLLSFGDSDDRAQAVAKRAADVLERENKQKADVQRREAERQQREAERMTDNVVRYSADAFADLFGKTGRGWAGLWETMEATAKRTLARIAAEAVIRPIVQPIVQGLVGGGGAGGAGGDIYSGALQSGGSIASSLGVFQLGGLLGPDRAAAPAGDGVTYGGGRAAPEAAGGGFSLSSLSNAGGLLSKGYEYFGGGGLGGAFSGVGNTVNGWGASSGLFGNGISPLAQGPTLSGAPLGATSQSGLFGTSTATGALGGIAGGIGLGMAGGSIVGGMRGSVNATQNSMIGSVAGAGIGFLVGGPVGALVGGAIGGTASGFFGPTEKGMAQRSGGDVAYAAGPDGRLVVVGSGGKRWNAEESIAGVQTQIDAINETFSARGLRLSTAANGMVGFGQASRNPTSIDPNNLAQFLFSDSANVNRVLANRGGKGIEQILGDVDWVKQTYEPATADAAAATSAFAQSLTALAAQYSPLIDKAAALGLETGKLSAAWTKATDDAIAARDRAVAQTFDGLAQRQANAEGRGFDAARGSQAAGFAAELLAMKQQLEALGAPEGTVAGFAGTLQAIQARESSNMVAARDASFLGLMQGLAGRDVRLRAGDQAADDYAYGLQQAGEAAAFRQQMEALGASAQTVAEQMARLATIQGEEREAREAALAQQRQAVAEQQAAAAAARTAQRNGTARGLLEQLAMGDLGGLGGETRFFAGVSSLNAAKRGLAESGGADDALAEYVRIAQQVLPVARDFLGTSERYAGLTAEVAGTLKSYAPGGDPANLAALIESQATGSDQITETLLSTAGVTNDLLARIQSDIARLAVQIGAVVARAAA